METLRLDTYSLVIAHENHHPHYQFYIDRDYALQGVMDIFRVNVVDDDDPINYHELIEEMQIDPARFIRILPFTEQEAIYLRQDFIASLPRSHARSQLSLSLRQSFPLRRLYARELFDALIGHFPEEREAWVNFQERAVSKHSRKWLRAEAQVSAKIQPLRRPDGKPLETRYRYSDEQMTKGYHPVAVFKVPTPDNGQAPVTGQPAISIEVIYVGNWDWRHSELELRPDGLFFAHHENRFNESIFFYFEEETYSRNKEALSHYCDSMLVLQAPGQLMEELIPLGVLHYGLDRGEIAPVFDDLKVHFTQTQRDLDSLLGEGRISEGEHDQLSGELGGGVAGFALAG
jgi:hypothetical protein